MPIIEKNLESILARIRSAAERAGRDPACVRLVAVSKTHPAEAVRHVLDTGQRVFGESKVQEASGKIPLLPRDLEWHFIGHLQTNKIRKALPLFHLFHGVDNSGLAGQMDRIAGECGCFPKILLEVNVSGEGTKFGFRPDGLKTEIAGLLALPRVQVVGLMTMAPYAADPEASRPYFAALRKLRDELEQQTGTPLPELSMGMSGDFEQAVGEGSSLVRIGTAIFGDRPRKIATPDL
ncbi:MAG: YggS family pyridoxal phosphate-dependent enzyme [Verrucomicrobiaceae bacterium]|nr:MAG: YggS family pyridoxal phosphate-dependent enzyme [Verrucomicrobiaceae bacterium]